MTDTSEQDQTSAPLIIETNMRTLFGVLLLGAFVGALVVGASILLKQYFVVPVFCSSADSFTLCADGGGLAFNIATVLVGVVGAVGLVKMKVYRPLLVVIAAAATLWSANAWLGVFPWYEMLAWVSGLYAAAYLLYTWVLRAGNFVFAFFLTVALVVAARFILQI